LGGPRVFRRQRHRPAFRAHHYRDRACPAITTARSSSSRWIVRRLQRARGNGFAL
jgi:hypothetical protein